VTDGDAIAYAEQAALEAGYRLDEYDQASVTSDDPGLEDLPRLKPPGRPGGHFAVRVEAGASVSITPGR